MMARVLVVEDDAAGLIIRKLVLERRGYEVIGASTAAAAREKIAQEPDAIVLDLRLPEPDDGLALIREFRAAMPRARIVVLCGNRADIDGREEAAMADAILAKPSPSGALLAAIGGGDGD
jgi:CheY-like chemotaxis protein